MSWLLLDQVLYTVYAEDRDRKTEHLNWLGDYVCCTMANGAFEEKYPAIGLKKEGRKKKNLSILFWIYIFTGWGILAKTQFLILVGYFPEYLPQQHRKASPRTLHISKRDWLHSPQILIYICSCNPLGLLSNYHKKKLTRFGRILFFSVFYLTAQT